MLIPILQYNKTEKYSAEEDREGSGYNAGFDLLPRVQGVHNTDDHQ